MMYSKKAISFPLLLFPFVLVLVLLFSLQVIDEKDSMITNYGQLSLDVMELNNQALTNELWYQQGIKEVYYTTMINEISAKTSCSSHQSSLDRQDRANFNSEFVYSDVGDNNYFCNMSFGDPITLERFNASLSRIMNNISEKRADPFSSNYNSDFSRQDINYSIDERNDTIRVTINSSIVKENEDRGYVIRNNDTYEINVNPVSLETLKEAPFREKDVIKEYKTMLLQCGITQDIHICFEELTPNYFSIEGFELNPKLIVESPNDFVFYKVTLAYELYQGKEFIIQMNLDGNDIE